MWKIGNTSILKRPFETYCVIKGIISCLCSFEKYRAAFILLLDLFILYQKPIEYSFCINYATIEHIFIFLI